MRSTVLPGKCLLLLTVVASMPLFFQPGDAQAGIHWNTMRREGCVRDGYRMYWARLDDIPRNLTWEKACSGMPATIAGRYFHHPTRCKNKGVSGMFGEWDVPDDSCSKCGQIAREYVNHFVHRVSYNENRNINFRRNRQRVGENTWGLVTRDLRSDLNRRGATPNSALERCVKGKVIAAAASQRKLTEHINYWGGALPTSCPAIVTEYLKHYQARVKWNENTDRKMRENRAWVANNTFTLVRRDLGSELNQMGARPGTPLEACVKKGLINAAKKDLDHHIWYWKKSVLGKMRKGFEAVGDWFTGIGKKLKDGIVNGLKGLANLAMRGILELAKPMLIKVIDSVAKKVGFTAVDIKFVRNAAGKVDRKRVREVVTRRLVQQYIQPRLKAKVAKLIDKGLEKIQKPIDAVASAVVGSLGSIPFVGGMLAAGVGFAMRLGLDQLRGLVGNLITKLVMSKLVQPIINKGIEFLRTLGSTVRNAMDVLYRRGYEFFEQFTHLPGKGASAASGGGGGVFPASALSQGWQIMAGKLVQVSAGSAKHVWGLARDGSIWRWTGGAWKGVPGKLKQISAGNDGTVWGLGTNAKLHRWSGNKWEQMPGALEQISVGSAKHVWGVAKDHTIWRWNGKGWDKVNGGLEYVSTGADGTTWGLMGGKVYRFAGGKSWTAVAGELSQISVGSAAHVWGLSGGSIHRWTGSSWAKVPGGLVNLAVGADGLVWGTDSTDAVFKRTR